MKWNRAADLTSAMVLAAISICGGCAPSDGTKTTANDLLLPEEVHLRNIRQLTFGGENAEAYFSPDGSQLILQSKRDGRECDQIYLLDLESGAVEMVSTGAGVTTCSFVFPDDERILYSSTHLTDEHCPPPVDHSQGYVWKLHPEFEIFVARRDGSGLTQITDHVGYDAEATISPDGETIIFTSLRDGDLDLYTIKPDGTELTRLTTDFGYDGGAFFSRDGKRIVWRASRPKTDEEIADFRELLEASAIRPMNLELFVANADGTDARQVTDNGQANFGPYFFPQADRIIFASNLGGSPRKFDLWMIGTDGEALEQITFHPEFDGFPMFSPDGRHLVWASNRGNEIEGETNIFIAEWVDAPSEPIK
jgi:Tol biopolymer transport system component